MSWLCKLFCPNVSREITSLRLTNTKTDEKYNGLVKKYNALVDDSDLLRTELQKAKKISPKETREFRSLSELQKFIRENDIDMEKFVPTKNDCDDFARKTQQAAAEKGFILNCQYDREGDTAHMLNTAIIAGKIYKIEPQTDRIWFFTNLD